MIMKHTPGPWKVGSTVTDYNAVGGELGIGLKIHFAGQDHEWHVATVYGQTEEGEPLTCKQGYRSANARLIAAAPDLLEALETLLEAFVHIPGDEAGNKARTAIFAKCKNTAAATTKARATIAKATGN